MHNNALSSFQNVIIYGKFFIWICPLRPSPSPASPKSKFMLLCSWSLMKEYIYTIKNFRIDKKRYIMHIYNQISNFMHGIFPPYFCNVSLQKIATYIIYVYKCIWGQKLDCRGHNTFPFWGDLECSLLSSASAHSDFLGKCTAKCTENYMHLYI